METVKVDCASCCAVALSRWRGYSWLVALLALLVVTISNGMINSGITVFDESLLEGIRRMGEAVNDVDGVADFVAQGVPA